MSTADRSRLGKQIAIELYGCDRRRLDDVSFIRQAMLEAAQEAGAQIVTEIFHRFSPHGISGVVVITESHLAIHTWPEHAYAAVDLFTCGDRLATHKAIHHLRLCLNSDRVTSLELPRGPMILKNTRRFVEQWQDAPDCGEGSYESLLDPCDLSG